MREIILDVREANDPRELHDSIRNAFELRDFYGANLDALFDALTSVGQETEVTLRYRPEKQQPYLNYQNKALRVLQDAQEENPRLHFVFEAE